MTKKEFYFSSANQKARMRAVEWLPEGEPKAVIHLFHGSSRPACNYEELASFFTEHGFVVIENEHSGQEELHACLTVIKETYPDVPCLLLGCSGGVPLVYSFVKENPSAVEGIVLADAGQESHHLEKNIPVLQVAGVENNCQEVLHHIYHWTEERLDEMLYQAATKQ